MSDRRAHRQRVFSGMLMGRTVPREDTMMCSLVFLLH